MMIMMTTTAAYDYYNVGVGVSKGNISLYRRAILVNVRFLVSERAKTVGAGAGAGQD